MTNPMDIAISVSGSTQDLTPLRNQLIQRPDVHLTLKLGDAETIVARCGPDASVTISEWGSSLDFKARKVLGDRTREVADESPESRLALIASLLRTLDFGGKWVENAPQQDFTATGRGYVWVAITEAARGVTVPGFEDAREKARGSWSKSPPTKPGWYWCRQLGQAEIVELRGLVPSDQRLYSKTLHGLEVDEIEDDWGLEFWSEMLEPPK